MKQREKHTPFSLLLLVFTMRFTKVIVTKDRIWQPEVTWLNGYFSFALWSSLGIFILMRHSVIFIHCTSSKDIEFFSKYGVISHTILLFSVNIMIFLLVSCTPKQEIPQEGDFSVLSYNIHGLPSAITGDDTTMRMNLIAPLLNDFLLVGLQEDWMQEHHETIMDGNSHPYERYFDEKIDEEKVYGAGLSFLSTYSIIDHQHIHYESCFGYLENSSDCFASKGLQFMEIALHDDVIIHIYNTHLEAGGGQEDHLVRQEQIESILQALQSYSLDHPVIVMGDFNLRYSDPIDLPLLEKLIEEGNLEQSCFATSCTEEDHIDQIFFRSSTQTTLQVNSWTRNNYFIDDEGIDLSDHPAISSSFSWSHQP